MSNDHPKSLFNRIGCLVSSWVSDLAATPAAQIAIIAICAAWFAGGFATDVLTAILSIMAITLTQMVLNRQNEREADAHRRDVAMHAKLDELVLSVKGARNEMAGIEELDEEDIAELKEEVKDAIDETGALRPGQREAAKKAVDIAVEDEVSKARASKARRRPQRAAGSARR